MTGQYIDPQICALDGVMICYKNEERRVCVPARAGDMPLELLGSGALCLPNALEVTVEEGYTAIADFIALAKPFVEQWPQTQVTLPSTLRGWASPEGRFLGYPRKLNLRRRLSEQDYRGLMEHSVPAGMGFRVLDSEALGQPACRVMAELMKGMAGSIVNDIDPELPLYFWRKETDGSVFAPLECMGLDARGPEHTENDGVLKRIRSGNMGRRLGEAERENDRYYQKGEKLEARRALSAVVGFNEDAAIHSRGEVFMTLTAVLGYLFNQMLRRVDLEGKDYYVYSRRFLKSTGVSYLREDMCVYSREGLVTDAVVSRRVYEKYRLLNMI